MLLSETTTEYGSLLNAAYAIVAGLVFIGFFLGVLVQKVKTMEKKQDGFDSVVHEIFNKLDELAKGLPHECRQIANLANLQADVKAHAATLIEHAGRMDRIQQAIRDKEQKHAHDEVDA